MADPPPLGTYTRTSDTARCAYAWMSLYSRCSTSLLAVSSFQQKRTAKTPPSGWPMAAAHTLAPSTLPGDCTSQHMSSLPLELTMCASVMPPHRVVVANAAMTSCRACKDSIAYCRMRLHAAAACITASSELPPPLPLPLSLPLPLPLPLPSSLLLARLGAVRNSGSGSGRGSGRGSGSGSGRTILEDIGRNYGSRGVVRVTSPTA